MFIWTLFAGLMNFLLREVVVKFVIITAVYSVLAIVVPKAISLIAPFIGAQNLTSAFMSQDSGAWYFLDMAALDYGIPLLLSAFITRFLIRRLPLIG